MRKKPSKTTTKTCPFLDENCVKGNCELYNALLDTCQLGLLNYNIYQLMTVMKQQIEIEMNKRI
jgi:hypothetical protein